MAETTDLARVYFDVDGVLSPVGVVDEDTIKLRSVTPGVGSHYDVLVAPLGWIAALNARAGVGVRWATTHPAASRRQISDKAGVGALPGPDCDGAALEAEHGVRRKILAIEPDAGSLPLAWIDDTFVRSEDLKTPTGVETDVAWARRRTASGVPTLLVSCRSWAGIRPHHYDLVDGWLAAVLAGDLERATRISEWAADSIAAAPADVFELPPAPKI